MKLTPTAARIAELTADALVVGLYEDAPLAGFAEEADALLGGQLGRLQEAKEITGKQGELVTLPAPAGLQVGQLVVLGLGKKEKLSAQSVARAAGAAAKQIAGKARKSVAFYLDAHWSDELVAAAAAAALAGCVGQDLYRAEKNRHPFEEILWPEANAAGLEAGSVLGESVNLARRLVNEPPHAMYPESFAAEAERIAGELGIECEIWDEQRLAAERCGSLLAVGQGSARPPRLVIMRYAGAASDRPWLTLVGKGVTFDSGGYSIKPSDGMATMKCDMAGAATVLAAVQAIARLKLPVNVMGCIGLAENMVSGNAYKLGDVLTARSGKTIEVLNTDAEGRLVLADVLNVAIERGAAKIVDLATLTGACVVALGNDVAGVMTNDQAWCDEFLAAAREQGEQAWQLPMFEEFGKQIRSEVADIKNVGEGRWGGAITAAKFLEEFVEGEPWVHVDIAGPAFLDKPKPWLDGGGSGAFVRTLVELARRWKE